MAENLTKTFSSFKRSKWTTVTANKLRPLNFLISKHVTKYQDTMHWTSVTRFALVVGLAT